MIKDLVGKRFNKLTVEEFAGKQGRKTLWWCRCDCGARVQIRSDTLQRESKSCGGPACFMSHLQGYPKEGDRFGMLVAHKFSHTNKRGGGVYWKFTCDCGTQVSMRWHRVRDGERDHCGCRSIEKMVLGHAKGADRTRNPLRDLLGDYKRNAAVRNLEFSLTHEQFYKLTTSNCFFCGAAPTNPKKARKREFLPDVPDYLHNGVDRWYSHLGYTVENCVPCCKTCNYAKRSLSGEQFIKWALGIVGHVKELESTWQEKKKAVAETLRLF